MTRKIHRRVAIVGALLSTWIQIKAGKKVEESQFAAPFLWSARGKNARRHYKKLYQSIGRVRRGPKVRKNEPTNAGKINRHR